MVNDNLTEEDKRFLVSYEKGEPEWSLCSSGYLGDYPSVKWKLQNINKLRNTNTKKFEESISKLTDYFGLKMYQEKAYMEDKLKHILVRSSACI